MYLDISHQPEAFVRSHFPMIYEKLLTFGFDLTKDRIPVVPAAIHLRWRHGQPQGRTDINGLYASVKSATPACTVQSHGLQLAARMPLNMAGRQQRICCVFLPEVEAVDNLPAWDDSQVDDAMNGGDSA